MKKTSFSIANLRMGDDRIFSLADFSHIKGKKVIDPEDDGNEHVIITEVKSIGQFFCVYFKEGDTKPRPSEVFNTKVSSMEANPKKEHQVEMYTQTFVLIEPESQRIFLSNYTKKRRVKEWLDKELGQDVIIADIINEEEFISSLKALHSVHFSRERGKESYQDMILDSELEVLGKEVNVGKIEVTATFDSTSFSSNAKKILRKLLRDKKSEPGRIKIAGSTHDGIERTFNTQRIVDKIWVEVQKKGDGLYEKNDMFSSLIKSIKNHEQN